MTSGRSRPTRSTSLRSNSESRKFSSNLTQSRTAPSRSSTAARTAASLRPSPFDSASTRGTAPLRRPCGANGAWSTFASSPSRTRKNSRVSLRRRSSSFTPAATTGSILPSATSKHRRRSAFHAALTSDVPSDDRNVNRWSTNPLYAAFRPSSTRQSPRASASSMRGNRSGAYANDSMARLTAYLKSAYGDLAPISSRPLAVSAMSTVA